MAIAVQQIYPVGIELALAWPLRPAEGDPRALPGA